MCLIGLLLHYEYFFFGFDRCVGLEAEKITKIDSWSPPRPCASMIPPGLEEQLAGASYEVFAAGGDDNAEWMPDHGTKDFTNAFIADEKNKKVRGLQLCGTGTNERLPSSNVRFCWDARSEGSPRGCM